MATHGNPSDGASSPASASASGTSTPAAYAPAPPAKAPEAAKAKTSEEKSGYKGSTSKVEVVAQLQASAEDIWGLLTDEKRIPMWSRSNAKVRAGIIGWKRKGSAD